MLNSKPGTRYSSDRIRATKLPRAKLEYEERGSGGTTGLMQWGALWNMLQINYRGGYMIVYGESRRIYRDFSQEGNAI
ncbi:unnamed protein product [Rhizoctonia solani]|uniref:Uncharacterized protein n=1 Tax=Rhizoctonia solani TaxID=456999 RepID=A0A8H3HQ38_9AGAM|nr:unnamed protein product [Rhizoctonia solani]